MKAKKLMIGDWVNINESNPLYARVSFVNKWKIGWEGIGDRDEEDIYPIPLTEEILKANGFEMRGVQFAEKDVNFTFDFGSGISKGVAHIQVFVDKTHRLNIKLPQRYNNGSVGLDLVCYVHELQHALRLCGLNEIADNFKVE